MGRKMYFFLFIGAIFLFLLTPGTVYAQRFYALDTIQKIEIWFTNSNWDYILDTAKQGSDGYTVAQWVKINGVQYDSAGVKYKGNSSYNPNNAKNPLHIELDYIRNQDYQGYKDIKLSNGYNEPSFVREAITYMMLQNYMQAPVANFAQVYINGQYMGLYTNVEAITKTFLNSRFYSNDNSFFFCDLGGCSLSYKGSDSTLYYSPYTIKSVYGWTDLVKLCNTLKNNINGIENILDVDRSLWMMAFTNVTVTLDSYLGSSKHNYYIYEDHNGRFNPVIWDLNGSFGVFNKADGGIPLTVSQMQNLSPVLHSNDSLWPLVKQLLSVPLFYRMYTAHMRTIVKENFSDTSYFTTAKNIQSIIDTAVQSDPNKFFTYSQFLSNLTTNVVSGPKTIPGITFLMDTRTAYLNSTAEFQQVPPAITNILPSDSFPVINSSIYITAGVSNAAAVYLGLRYAAKDKFTRMIMYDDGAHGDGAPGDGTYGISVPVSSSEIQYYIYAENSNAGIFSPERAEHEYYVLGSDYVTITAGEVVINEIMAVNSSTVQNNKGLYGDWIELYNNSTNPVLLDNLNLSDDAAVLTKWTFPPGVTIPPYGYLIVWADNDTAAGELHCDFKFSGNGEQAVIAYANGTIVDSISFPVQSADITWGRLPNGTGPFVLMPPTFNSINSFFGVNESYYENNDLSVYPNPSTGIFSVCSPVSGSRLIIVDVFGREVFQKTLNTKHETINLNLPCGIYFCQISTDHFVQTKKLEVIR